MGHVGRAVLIAAVSMLAAGCSTLDGDQLWLCRQVLPVLHPSQTEIREIRVGPSALGRQGIRIEYAAREAGGSVRQHWIACGFAGKALEAARGDLIAVNTDEGALGEARLLFLKRFWLHDWQAVRDHERVPDPAVREIPASFAYGLQQIINAISLSAVYGLLATAFALIYGLIGRLNLAFGEIAVVGAYGGVGGIAIAFAMGLEDALAGLAVALLLSAALAGLWSWFAGRAVIVPLHERFRHGQPILVATVALAVAMQEFLRLSQGERWVPPLFSRPITLARADDFAVTVTPLQMVIALMALTAAGSVLVVLARSRFGRAWRAYADDPGAVALFGIDVHRLLASTFLLAGAMAGLAGWIVAVYYGNVSASTGTMLGLKALIGAVLGGIGSVPGAFLGGILVGVIESMWSAYADIAMRDIVTYFILIVVFVLRPGGLLGFAGPSPRQV